MFFRNATSSWERKGISAVSRGGIFGSNMALVKDFMLSQIKFRFKLEPGGLFIFRLCPLVVRVRKVKKTLCQAKASSFLSLKLL